MIIESARIDRYVFDSYVAASRTAQEWIREAERVAPWFTPELLADFFLCFYLPRPTVAAGEGEPPFHRWLVAGLLKQHFYRSIHPRTTGSVNASFRTSLKALMWLTGSYAEEAARRRQDREKLLSLGLGEKQQQAGEDRSQLSDMLSEKQIRQLQLVGYTLQQGKRRIEDKQAAEDAKPLDEAEIRAVKERVNTLKEQMRTEFLKRDKLRAKLKKAEEELAARERQRARLDSRERESFARLDEKLGGWLGRSLQETLGEENAETESLAGLIRASQLVANRRWGSDLGRLQRQAYADYLAWVEKLKRNPDLLAFLRDVGRNVQQLKAKRRKARSNRVPETYDDLRQSGDISHMLPSEAALLAEADYESLFLMKWLDRKLLTYTISGRIEEPEKGPVVCMLDTSHSMRGAKLRLAQLFAATFASLCLLERRDFILLLFGAGGELKEQPLYARKPDWPAFYALSQMAFGGGTSFDAPLKRGIELVTAEPRYRDADFVMVTDGIGAISPPVRAKLAELAGTRDVRLHSLLIGSARAHLAQPYDILGVSHRIRFASTWETQDEANGELLLDVLRKEAPGRGGRGGRGRRSGSV